MSKNDPDKLNYYHNKGQQDYSEGKQDVPHSGLLSILNNSKQEAQAGAYRDGWRNARKDSKR